MGALCPGHSDPSGRSLRARPRNHASAARRWPSSAAVRRPFLCSKPSNVLAHDRRQVFPKSLSLLGCGACGAPNGNVPTGDAPPLSLSSRFGHRSSAISGRLPCDLRCEAGEVRITRCLALVAIHVSIIAHADKCGHGRVTTERDRVITGAEDRTALIADFPLGFDTLRNEMRFSSDRLAWDT